MLYPDAQHRRTLGCCIPSYPTKVPTSLTSRGLARCWQVMGMGMRVCAEPGCPELQPESRCAEHRREREQRRGSRQQRGYGPKHQAMRRGYQRRMDKGEAFTCWRCPCPIDPDEWALGHCDSDRGRYHGPECPPCNDATSSRRGVRCPHPSHPWAPGYPSPRHALMVTAEEVKSAAYASPTFRTGPEPSRRRDAGRATSTRRDVAQEV